CTRRLPSSCHQWFPIHSITPRRTESTPSSAAHMLTRIPYVVSVQIATRRHLVEYPKEPAVSGRNEDRLRAWPGKLVPDAADEAFDRKVELVEGGFLLVGPGVHHAPPDVILQHQHPHRAG